MSENDVILEQVSNFIQKGWPNKSPNSQQNHTLDIGMSYIQWINL